MLIIPVYYEELTSSSVTDRANTSVTVQLLSLPYEQLFPSICYTPPYKDLL